MSLQPYGQTTTVYLIHGQGSDKRIFDSFSLPVQYKKKFLEYGVPQKGQSLKDFALQISALIDTNEAYILIGHSLGGMICAEINEFLDPQKVIIISGAENRNELPWRYRFQKTIPIYKILPGRLLLWGARLLQPIVEPDSKKHKNVFKSMLAGKNGQYMKRTIHMIITWDRTANTKKNFKVHGTKDHTLPFKMTKQPDYVIKNGSHMIILINALEVNVVVNKILAGS